MNATVQWIFTSYLKIPDLPEFRNRIHSVSIPDPDCGQKPWPWWRFEATAAEILQVQSLVQELFEPNINAIDHETR